MTEEINTTGATEYNPEIFSDPGQNEFISSEKKYQGTNLSSKVMLFFHNCKDYSESSGPYNCKLNMTKVYITGGLLLAGIAFSIYKVVK